MDKKVLIRRFTQEGFTLRPECVVHLLEYFQGLLPAGKKHKKELSTEESEPFLERIIENVRVLAARTGGVIVEEETMKGAIDLLQRPSNIATQMEVENERNDPAEILDEDEIKQRQQVNNIVQEKYLKSIVVLETMRESANLIVAHGKVTVKEQPIKKTKNSKQQSTVGTPHQKTAMFVSRLQLVKTLLQAQPQKYIFTRDQAKKPKEHTIISHEKQINQEGAEQQQTIIEISDIGSLIGSKEQEKYVLGIVYEGFAGQFYLQDELSQVHLELTEAQVTSGYVCLSSVVIAKGVYDSMKSLLRITELIQPTTEPIFPSLTHLDLFGAKTKVNSILSKLISLEIQANQHNPGNLAVHQHTRMQKERQVQLGFFDLELNPAFSYKDRDNYLICVISEFNLTNRATLKKLETLLSGLKEIKPLLFVLLGPFFGEISSTAQKEDMEEAISELGILISKFKEIRDNAYWILIPHASDIGGAAMLPKSELPEELFAGLKEQVPYLKLAQNPCRISFMGKTLLFSRNDLLKDLRKKQIALNGSSDILKTYVQTILAQKHLSPISLINKPVIWNYDYTLQFAQIPDYLILADSYCDQFEFPVTVNEESSSQEQNSLPSQKQYVLNPGNFDKKSTFTVIYPLLGEIQASSL